MSDVQLTSIDNLFSSAPKRRFKTLAPLPVSGHVLRIRSLTERELSAYHAATITQGGTGLKKARLEDANRRMIGQCVVDVEGNRLFTDAHLAKLSEWDAADTQFLYNECASHVGIKTEDIEGLIKNSEGTSVVD